MAEIKTITRDGTSYPVEQFSAEVQHLVAIYNKFQAQLPDLQLEVMKTQAAMNQLNEEIGKYVDKELRAQAVESIPDSDLKT